MNDQYDVQLEDAELLAEMELTTDLMIAASQLETPLPAQEIDRILIGGHAAVGELHPTS